MITWPGSLFRGLTTRWPKKWSLVALDKFSTVSLYPTNTSILVNNYRCWLMQPTISVIKSSYWFRISSRFHTACIKEIKYCITLSYSMIVTKILTIMSLNPWNQPVTFRHWQKFCWIDPLSILLSNCTHETKAKLWDRKLCDPSISRFVTIHTCHR